MSKDNEKQPRRFLGRVYDACTDSWVFPDGSGSRITNMARDNAIWGRDVVPFLDIWSLIGPSNSVDDK